MSERGKTRLGTSLVLAMTVLLMLLGFGQRVVDSYSSFGNADRLAALSLIMSGVPDGALPVTFLDVDDATRLAWGAVAATPHAALAELARQSAANGATAVLVDFDLAGDAQPDAGLLEFLDSYPAGGPPLMLARKIRFERGQQPQVGLETPTPYDAAVAGKPSIHWVTTLNDIGADRVVRRIRLFETVCNGAGGRTYPSAALVAAAYLASAPQRRTELGAFLEQVTAAQCGGASLPERPDWPPVQAGSAPLPYVFGDQAKQSALFRINVSGRESVVLRRISAGLLATYSEGLARAAGEVDSDPFAGRVVVIGASYSDSGDFHETPLGSMPGALIVANSIVQAQHVVEASPASAFTVNALAAVLFLALVIAARHFIAAAAVIILAVVIFAALFAVSRWAGYAAAIDVVSVAVPGFALFKLIDSLILIAMSVPKRGWRAVLKQ